MSTPFTLIAKAGGADEGPENTCEAIERVLWAPKVSDIEFAVEVDVRLSADGAPVVIHDATLERTTDGHGAVRARTLAELKRVHAGPSGERVPALEEVLDLVRSHPLVVELHDAGTEMVDALIFVLRRVLGSRDNLIVASEHGAVVRALRALEPGLRTAATPAEAWRKLLLERLHLERWAPRGQLWIVPVEHRGLRVVTRRFVQSAARVGDPVWCYVVNDSAEAERLRALGVAGCFSTCPVALSQALSASSGPRDAPTDDDLCVIPHQPKGQKTSVAG